MSSKTRTGARRESRSANVGAPQWRPVRWQWRKPHILEITGSLTGVPVVASIAGYVPEGAPALSVAGAMALHLVADLVARCVRRTRD